MHKSNPQLKVNPGGLLTPSQVVGRDAFIKSLWRGLESQSILLTSERRMGKTSVMRKMTEESPPGVCPIQRSLQGINAPEEFARALVADVEKNIPDVLSRPIVKRLRKAGVKKVGAQSVEVEFEPISEEAWKDVVIETFATIEAGVDERVVFLWDELPHVVDAIEGKRDPNTARDLLDVLRHVRETYPSIRMILSGSLGMHHVVDKLRSKGGMWAPTNDMAMVDLAPLDGGDAEYLALELLRNEAIECGDDEAAIAAAIASEVDHVPYYVHHTVAGLQREQEGTGESVDVGMAVGAIAAALAEPQDPWQLKHYVDRVPVYYPAESELAFAVLDAVAAAGRPCSLGEIENLLAAQAAPPGKEQLHSLLELLCKDHYLEPGYSFRLDLVRRAWLARRPPR